MIELFDQNITTNDRQSSKGNQLKWQKDNEWYKTDYTGYEGLAEYMISHLLQYSNLEESLNVLYETEKISYKKVIYLGCRSQNFIRKSDQLITLERLFQQIYGESLNRSIYCITNVEERISFLTEQMERIMGKKGFGSYLCRLLTIDALFLNGDRHTHNMALILNSFGEYEYCPVFDNGAALLSDTSMDYPMGISLEEGIGQVKAKTFCADFDLQLETAERLYGQQIKFFYGEKEITELLTAETNYPLEVKNRVKEILLLQRRKYLYLFSSTIF